MRPAIKLASLLLVASLASCSCADAPLPTAGTLQPLFGPWDNIEAKLLEEVASARRQILVQAYLLTSKNFARALADARRRGLYVAVLIDEKQLARAGDAATRILSAADVSVFVETGYENAHNKLLIIDPGTPSATVITGSYNFTWTAQHRNAENILIVRNDPALAARYASNWGRHREYAVPYKP